MSVLQRSGLEIQHADTSPARFAGASKGKQTLSEGAGEGSGIARFLRGQKYQPGPRSQHPQPSPLPLVRLLQSPRALKPSGPFKPLRLAYAWS